MRKTTFAGITVLENGESLVQDDGSFTDKDRDTIDFFLERGAKTHRHTGLGGLTNPAVAASGTVHASGGTIPSDLDLVFGYTLQDDERGETILSPTATISTPAPLTRPENTIIATLDYLAGTLTVDSYYYAITYVDGEGGETPLGPTTIAIRQSGHANAQVVLTGLDDGMAGAGAAGWRLYRARAGGQFAFLAAGTGDTYTDNGSVSPVCDSQPPNDEFNTTNEINSIVITLPDAGDIDPDAQFINVYLSDSGAFTGNVFLDQFPVASAGRDVVYRDIVLQDDRPPVVSTSVGGPPKIDGDTEIDWGDGGVPGDPSLMHIGGPLVPDVRLVQFAASGDASVSVTASGGGSALVTIGADGDIEVTDADGPVFDNIKKLKFVASGGAGASVTNLGGGSAQVEVGGSDGPIREVLDFGFAGVLASGVGNASLGAEPSMRAIYFDSNVPVRFRLYMTSADRTADSARPIGTDPTGDHGLIMEVVTTLANLSFRLSPQVDMSSDPGDLTGPPHTHTYFAAVENRSGATNDLDLTLVWIPTERR